MSYSIIAKKKNGESHEIPISTHHLFHDYWLPLFNQHKMRNLMNLKYPHDLEKEELKELIKEYKKLAPHVNGDWEEQRLKFIIEEMEALHYDEYEYIAFG
jgi:hypothetical protein